MERYYGDVRTRVSLTNDSTRLLVVGNHQEIISHHTTREDAAAAADEIGMGSDGAAGTRWGVVEIVAPGRTVVGDLVRPLRADDGAEVSDAEMRAMFGLVD